ncbi:MAG: hypothetical protein KIT40_17480 [Nitrospira sp.]|nr:hypothetical protein [Nitrospira sp.]
MPAKGTFWTLSGDKEIIESYLTRFAWVPVFCGNPPRRQLARPTIESGWELRDPDGSTELEKHPEVVENLLDQERFITTHIWHHIGFAVHKQLTQVEFGKDGTGYSRHVLWGWGTVVPKLHDYHWRFSIRRNLINIEWQGEGTSCIGFKLRKELKAVGSLADGHLNFFELTLEVEAPLFPPSAEFAQHFLSEYLGKSIAETGGG